MKRLKGILGKWILTVMLTLLLTTCCFVLNNQAYLSEQKNQPVQQEQKLIIQEEAGVPTRIQHVSSASVHVGTVYLWTVPFDILKVCFLILYVMHCLAQLSFYGSCIVGCTKACYTEATRKCNNMGLNEARLHATPDCCGICIE